MSLEPDTRFGYALFDLDNTLTDRVVAVRHLALKLYDSDLLDKKVISVDEASNAFVKFDRDGNAHDKELFFNKVADVWGAMRRSPAELSEWYRTAPRDWYEPNAEVADFLGDLARAEVAWGIVTNGPATQLEKIRSLRLETGAKFILVSDIYGVAKPDPSIFLEALLRLDEPMPEDVLFIGDDPETDICGAQRVGMATAWIGRGKEWPSSLEPPDFFLDSVLETRPLLVV